MSNHLKILTWFWPVVIGLVVVIMITVLILHWGPRPAVAPGGEQSLNRPAPLLQSVALNPMVREYRGWLEVAAKPTITIKAPNAEKVQVSYWLVGAENGQWHEVSQQADGTWSATWPLPAGQKGHLTVKVWGRDGHQEQSETMNVLAVINQ